MEQDSFWNDIVEGLKNFKNGDAFEACAVGLTQELGLIRPKGVYN